MKTLILIFCLFIFISTHISAQDEPILVVDPQGHSGTVADMLFTNNGKTLISISNDKTIRFWDSHAGTLIRTLRGEFGEGADGVLFSCALSPDGHLFAIGGFPFKYGIRVFNLDNGAQEATLKGVKSGMNDLCFSPDGNLLAGACADKTIRIWKMNNKNNIEPRYAAVIEGHTAPVYSIAFSPDGKKLISGSFDGSVRMWNVSDLEAIKQIAIMRKHETEVRCVAYSPNGRQIVSGGFDNKILLWDTAGHFIRQIDELQQSINTLTFSSDGRNLLAMSKTGVVYSMATFKRLQIFNRHNNTVTAACFFKNDLVATAGGNDNDIYVWNPSNGEIISHIVGKGRTVWSLAFDNKVNIQPEYSLAIGNKSDPVSANNRGPLNQVFNLNNFTLQKTLADEKFFTRVKDEHLGTTLERIDNYTLEIKKGKSTWRITKAEGRINCYTFTKDGRVVIGTDFSLEIYSAEGKFMKKLVHHTGSIWSVSVSRDGKLLASGSDDFTINFWNLATGENLFTLFVGTDNEWVIWCKRGYYVASKGGEKYLGWHINKGIDHIAEFYEARTYRKKYYKPSLIQKIIQHASFEKAWLEYTRSVKPK